LKESEIKNEQAFSGRAKLALPLFPHTAFFMLPSAGDRHYCAGLISLQAAE